MERFLSISAIVVLLLTAGYATASPADASEEKALSTQPIDTIETDLEITESQEDDVYLLSTTVTSQMSVDEIQLETQLPEEISHVGGDLEWKGPVSAGDEITITAKVDPGEDGEYMISSEAVWDGPSETLLRGPDEVTVVVEDGEMRTEESEEDLVQLDAPTQEGNATVRDIKVEVDEFSIQNATEPSAAGTITVEGTAFHKDKNGDWDPLDNAEIVVWDVEWWGDNEKANTISDGDGDYSMVVDNCDACDGSGSGGIDVKVGMRSINDDEVRVEDDGGAEYEVKTEEIGSFSDGSTVEVNPGATDNNGAFRIHQYIDESNDNIETRTGDDIDKVYVTWPDPDASKPHYHPGGSKEMDLPENWDDGKVSKTPDIVYHEYGHHLMAWAHEYDVLTESCPDGASYGESLNEGCAHAEGWAEFHAAFVDNDPVNEWPDGDQVDFEDGLSRYDTGDETPFRVAGAFVDLDDGDNDGADLFNNPFWDVWQTLNADQGTFPGFKADWNDGEKEIVSAAGQNTIDYDDTDPNADLQRPEPGCDYLNNDKLGCDGDSDLYGTYIDVDGYGSDNVGIWKVQLFVDGETKRVDTDGGTSESVSWRWDYSTSDYGSEHDIRVKVWDFSKDATTEANLNALVLEE
jgi:hypothetical protein